MKNHQTPQDALKRLAITMASLKKESPEFKRLIEVKQALEKWANK